MPVEPVAAAAPPPDAGAAASPSAGAGLDYDRATRWVGRTMATLGALLGVLTLRECYQDSVSPDTDDTGVALGGLVILLALLVSVPVVLLGFGGLTRRLDVRGAYRAWRFLGLLVAGCALLSLVFGLSLEELLGGWSSRVAIGDVLRASLLIGGIASLVVLPLAALWCLGLRRR